MRRKDPGFTLIELLVVIFIISIIAVFIIVNTATTRAKARDKRRQTDITALATAFESYFAQNKKYPTSGLGLGIKPNQGYLISSDNFNDLIREYISEIPKDPLDGQKANNDMLYGYYYNSTDCRSSSSQTIIPAGSGYYINALMEVSDSSNTGTGNKMGIKDTHNYYYELGNIYYQRQSNTCQAE